MEQGDSPRNQEDNINLRKQNWLLIIILILFLIAVLTLMFQRFILGWSQWANWTGFGDYIGSIPKENREKTLWDWMDLLIIPLALALIALIYKKITHDTDQRLKNERLKNEKDIALDQWRENTIRAYFDEIINLLTNYNDKYRDKTDDNNNPIFDRYLLFSIRMKTITTLRILDGDKKGLLLQFLYEAKLLDNNEHSVDLREADFSGANLRNINLENAKLEEINFENADLFNTKLINSNLRKANLQNTNLIQAKLDSAIFSDAKLEYADLANTHLYETNFERANLYRTNFENAIMISANFTAAEVHDSDLTKAKITTITLTNGIKYFKFYSKKSKKNILIPMSSNDSNSKEYLKKLLKTLMEEM